MDKETEYTEQETILARMLRLYTIRSFYTIGFLEADEAKKLLNAPLDPDNPFTTYDDSDKLLWSEEQASEFFGLEKE